MKTICVSGTPGTGKTTLSKKLANKCDLYYLDVNKFVSQKRLYEGYDKKRKSKIVDIKKLNRGLLQFINYFKKNDGKIRLLDLRQLSSARSTATSSLSKLPGKIFFNKKYYGIIIDSHLSHYLLRKYVNLCIITKCDITELNKRLKNKKFSKNKIKENIQSEIFDICLNESRQRKHKIIVVDTTKDFKISAIVRKMGV